MVQIVEYDSTYVFSDEINEFHYIDKNLDLSDIRKIATLKGACNNSGKKTVVHLFNSLWETANKLGANSYQIEYFTNKSLDYLSVTVSIYILTEENLEYNFDIYPKNMVYVFGDLDKNKQAGKTIKFNSTKMKLPPLEYVSYQNKVGEDAILSIGGFLGAKVWIRGKEGRLPKHLSLNGFGIGPGSYYNDQLSISFNTGRIYPVDLSFGQFLVEILNKKI